MTTSHVFAPPPRDGCQELPRRGEQRDGDVATATASVHQNLLSEVLAPRSLTEDEKRRQELAQRRTEAQLLTCQELVQRRTEAQLLTCQELVHAISRVAEILTEAGGALQQTVTRQQTEGLATQLETKEAGVADSACCGLLLSTCKGLGVVLVNVAASLTGGVLFPLQDLQRAFEDQQKRKKEEITQWEHEEARIRKSLLECLQRKDKASLELQETAKESCSDRQGWPLKQGGKWLLGWVARSSANDRPEPSARLQQAAYAQTLAVEELAARSDQAAFARMQRTKTLEDFEKLQSTLKVQRSRVLTASMAECASALEHAANELHLSASNLHCLIAARGQEDSNPACLGGNAESAERVAASAASALEARKRVPPLKLKGLGGGSREVGAIATATWLTIQGGSSSSASSPPSSRSIESLEPPSPLSPPPLPPPRDEGVLLMTPPSDDALRHYCQTAKWLTASDSPEKSRDLAAEHVPSESLISTCPGSEHLVIPRKEASGSPRSTDGARNLNESTTDTFACGVREAAAKCSDAVSEQSAADAVLAVDSVRPERSISGSKGSVALPIPSRRQFSDDVLKKSDLSESSYESQGLGAISDSDVFDGNVGSESLGNKLSDPESRKEAETNNDDEALLEGQATIDYGHPGLEAFPDVAPSVDAGQSFGGAASPKGIDADTSHGTRHVIEALNIDPRPPQPPSIRSASSDEGGDSFVTEVVSASCEGSTGAVSP